MIIVFYDHNNILYTPVPCKSYFKYMFSLLYELCHENMGSIAYVYVTLND